MIQYSVISASISLQVAEYVERSPESSFITARDLDLPRGAVDTALSRISALGSLTRVRKGLYWKGARTRFGMTHPSVEEIAMRVGGTGSGPAEIAAARWLGLTTQVPSRFTLAVPVRAPRSMKAIRFSQRAFSRRLRELRPTEVAIIEVLRAGPSVMEADWPQFANSVNQLAENDTIRPTLLSKQINDEHHIATRNRWASLVATAPSLGKALTK